MSPWSFVVLALAALVAIVIALLILLRKDPIKSAFSGLTASLIVLTGSLGAHNIGFKAAMPTHDVFGIPMEIKEFVVSGTPPAVWITAFLGIAVLLAWLAKLISDDRNRERVAALEQYRVKPVGGERGVS